MKAYGGNGINLHSFLTWAINGVNDQLHALTTMALEPFWTLRKTIIWLKSRFFPRWTSGLRSSGILRSVGWYRVTDVSGQPFRPIFKETSVKKTTNYAAQHPTSAKIPNNLRFCRESNPDSVSFPGRGWSVYRLRHFDVLNRVYVTSVWKCLRHRENYTLGVHADTKRKYRIIIYVILSVYKRPRK